MKKVLHVAAREFLATVATKGFIIGVLVTPAILLVMIFVFPHLINEKAPRVEGEVAVVDRTGEVLEKLRDRLNPEAIAERQGEPLKKAMEEAPPQVRTLVEGAGGPGGKALEAARSKVPTLHIAGLSREADVDREKGPLKAAEPSGMKRLALIVVHEDAVAPRPGSDTYGGYDLYVRGKLDDRITDTIRDGLHEAIVDARVARAGLERGKIEALTHVQKSRPVTVTQAGEGTFGEIGNILLPVGFMILLLVSVMTSGQYILTSTVEEKSSRVVEVLLSAVSPMQLMTGKILGQLGVGLVILVLYAGLGIAALVSFAILGLLDMSLFLYLIIFFLIAYFTLASLMAAVGAAVNEMREAQTLMTPIMLVVMVPWLFWLPITRDPNSVFSTVISFIPPLSSFTMLLRLTSTAPPPWWQVWACILVGVASVYGAMWFAAKVFRVGLLMYGKPPNIATLLRWVRMA